MAILSLPLRHRCYTALGSATATATAYRYRNLGVYLHLTQQ